MPTDKTSPPADPPPPLVEGVDYTIEAGRWIFTAAFLRRRGTCCGSGCRHCPYDGAPTDSRHEPEKE